ncbi:MAG: ankyrin repeat domain-containing protein [Armatimonadia bacterium]
MHEAAINQAKGYVDQMRRRGRTDESIRNSLIRAGWHEPQISLVLEYTDHPQAVSPKHRQPQCIHTGTCPYCHIMIKTASRYVKCAACNTPHHEDCWTANGGCSIYGCGSLQVSVADSNEAQPLQACDDQSQFRSVQRAEDTRQALEAASRFLHDASVRGDLEEMRRQLNAGADPNATTEDGWTALHFAVSQGHADAAMQLLDGGANIAARLSEKNPVWGGQSAVHIASRSGHEIMLRQLMDRGADPNMKDADGRTPLHLAVRHRQTNCVGALLAARADVHAISTDGATPLHDAALVDCGEAAGMLLAAGAVVDAENNHGWTPLYLAAMFGRVAVAKFLLSAGGDPEHKGPDGETPLDAALHDGSREMLELMQDYAP